MAIREADARKESAEIDVRNLSSLLGNMNRLLVGLTSVPPFKNSDVGLGEWVALSALAKGESLPLRQLARSVGVPANRANQIVSRLSEGGLVSVGQAGEDKREIDIRVTESGRARLTAINSQLGPMLGSALKNADALARADKRVKSLMPLLRLKKFGKRGEAVEPPKE